ncbi:MAG: hypothetical protein AAF696_09065 [Bacteroidota bacterium]
MMEQELKDIWKQATYEELVSLDQEQLIRDMKEEHLKLEQEIRKRDRREISIAMLMMPCCLAAAFLFSSILSKVGAILMIPALGLVIYRLKALRKYEPTAFSESTNDYLHKLKIYYSMQRDLLKEVAYWYLIPIFICISMIYLGFSRSPMDKFVPIAVIASSYIVIYFINQSAVKKKYDPFLEEIDEKLAALGE